MSGSASSGSRGRSEGFAKSNTELLQMFRQAAAVNGKSLEEILASMASASSPPAASPSGLQALRAEAERTLYSSVRAWVMQDEFSTTCANG